MAFNSYEFLFVFVPLVLAGFFVTTRLADGGRGSRAWLLIASIGFYAYASVMSLVVLLPAIVVDYFIARALLRAGDEKQGLRAALFTLGLVLNIGVLCYFKYKNFFLDTANGVFGTDFPLTPLLLPLGLSFITFQKIAFLADVQSGQIKQFTFLEFLLFTLFFPRAIAGPIVHWQEVMPQLTDAPPRWNATNLAVGIGLFSIGLFKKVVIADGVANFVGPAFAPQPGGLHLTLIPAWTGALAYTFQLYFDFSGYSDMALGLARLFGVKLPVNFNSPLKSSSIVEFWSRWHATLTRFLTAYLYTPIVMHLTRARMAKGKPVLKGKKSTLSAIVALIAVPTLVTMAISGFWHGAGMQFIVWGLIHGVMLSMNQAWRTWRPRFWPDKERYERVMKPIGFVITFLSIVLAIVFFRAQSTQAALSMLASMVGAHGVAIPHAIGDRLGGLGDALQALGATFDWSSGSTFIASLFWLWLLFVIATMMPNSLELMRRYEPALDFKPEPPEAGAAQRGWPWRWVPQELALSGFSAALLALMFVAGAIALNRGGGFLYWKF